MFTNNMICPNCKSTISLHQIMSHRYSKPITCKNCSMQWQFEKKSWHKHNSPVFLIMLLLLSLILFGDALLTNQIYSTSLILGVGIFLMSLIWWAIKIKSIRIEPANNEKR